MPFKKVDILEEVKNLKGEDKFLYDVEITRLDFIQNLAKYRISKKLTQKDISNITGMTQQMVSRIEKYDNSPSLDNLLKYLKALDLDINDIF